MSNSELARAIERLVSDLPSDVIVQLATALSEALPADWRGRLLRLKQSAGTPAVEQKIDALVIAWRQIAPEMTPEAIALALQATAVAVENERMRERVSLVWTGPASHVVPLRRTDQVLLQLIEGAAHTLTIVSFAVYRIPVIKRAILGAAGRGVKIRLFIETPDASHGKMGFDTVSALGEEILSAVEVFEWPWEKRVADPDGRRGSLHAKVAIADAAIMLVSSANLTEYALKRNIELGVLIEEGQLPASVESHLDVLESTGHFKRLLS